MIIGGVLFSCFPRSGLVHFCKYFCFWYEARVFIFVNISLLLLRPRPGTFHDSMCCYDWCLVLGLTNLKTYIILSSLPSLTYLLTLGDMHIMFEDNNLNPWHVGVRHATGSMLDILLLEGWAGHDVYSPWGTYLSFWWIVRVMMMFLQLPCCGT